MGYSAPLILGCCALALAQESMPRDDKSDARMATFQAKVDLVLVPVVVRDKRRRPIGNLTKDDFRLFDNGKPRTIASFSTVERTKGTRENDKDTTAAPGAGSEQAGSDGGKDSRERYFIYLFDDVNTRFADMAKVRAAALSHFKNNFAAGDHASIYSISGGTSLEFTPDRERLEGSGLHFDHRAQRQLGVLHASERDLQPVAVLGSDVASHVQHAVARDRSEEHTSELQS